MNLWLVKNIYFGYKYADNHIREQIIKNSEWLSAFFIKNSKPDDHIIMCGGVFNSITPNIVAIDDARIFFESLQTKNIHLLNTQNCIKVFNGKNYSVNNIFNYNVIESITNIQGVSVIPYPFEYDNSINYIFNGVFNNVNIPNLYSDNNSGIVVYNTVKNKAITIANTSIKPNKQLTINSFDDIVNISSEYFNNEYNIELIINNELFTENKTRCDKLIFDLQPIKISYIKKEQNKIAVSFIDVDTAILSVIKDTEILKQFNRIKEISSKSAI